MKKLASPVRWLIVLALIALPVIGLFAASGGFSLNRAEAQAAQVTASPAPPNQGPQTTPVPANQAQSTDFLMQFQTALKNVYDAVNPSVVAIQVQGNLVAEGSLPPDHPAVPQQGLGSGFVWDKQGHIVTNNHVIEGANQIEVVFSNQEIVTATVVGADVNSDLAVLQVNVPAAQLQPVTLADMSQVQIGQLAIAIGTPFGQQGTMTVGIVSALNRSLPVSASTAAFYSIPSIIQTDAPINPGNSGGVLVNINGQVMGVTAAIESPVRANAGIGFAIPVTIVKRVVPSLIQTGQYQHPYLGIEGTSLSPALAQQMNLPATQRGALIINVAPNGPAAQAGLQPGQQQATINGQQVPVGGDVITAINGQQITNMDELITYLETSTQVGDTVTLTILRNGQTQQVKVKLTARPATQTPVPQQPQVTPQVGGTSLGIQGMTVTPQIAQGLNLPQDTRGVLVGDVLQGAPAASAGLQQGDIITGLAGQPVNSIDQLRTELQNHNPGEQVQLTILRNGQQQTLTVTLGQFNFPTG